ncbi:hypothetical protein N7494_001278 [Penicillium frequentans]|uniref:NB-ARC domain-containing protein n=1 Tax=Penicillium frequentans TaxID=3151616 RepID=A0AAD6D7H7_9EURO|nr:hypothetical protein N7494_001278 [Penicillium glabrum]
MTTITNSGTNDGVLVGTNNGTVTTQLHLSQRPKNPPSPLSTVPFKRDADFVSRDRLLDQIYEKGLISGSRIALVGLGGVGKSQLAIEYSYRVRSESPETWVFWVHASNAARFEQSFRDIAEQVKIPDRQDLKIDIFRLVEDWLRNEKRGKWILILDNVDDDELFQKKPAMRDAPTKLLLQYLPTSLPGYIIVTSRSREVAMKIVDYKNLLEIQPMDKSEGLELLSRKLDSDDNEESRQLVKELEFMPLAIVQAAGYIRSRAPRYSVSRYLAEFRNNDRKAINLLKQEGNPLYRDWEASNSVLVTWQMSFDHIRQKQPSAADLLSLMCFFDRQGIPEHLLRVQDTRNRDTNSELVNDSADDGEISGSESDIVDEFEDNIATLRGYSFISIVEDGSVFTMHRLVQLATRTWVESHGRLAIWTERFINNLCTAFPIGTYENWDTCGSFFPHVKSALSQRPKLLSLQSRRNWATLLHKSAWYTWKTGKIADMMEMATRSWKERVEILGSEDEDSLESTAVLAIAYEEQGQWKTAENLNVQVLDLRRAKLGEEHPGTLATMSNLAMMVCDQGRYEEAERLQMQVTEIRKRTIGEEHLGTLTSINNLAITYYEQGRYEEAERLQMQVMETRKTKLGEQHPDTLTSMGNLAITYCDQGRYEEAERLQMQVMETRKTKLGEQHPDTLTSMGNLAITYCDQGRYEEAERLQMQVMETRKTKLGEDHRNTLTSMANLAITYYDQGRYTEAERFEVQVLEASKKKLGEEHPDTLMCMFNLSWTWKRLGQTSDAIDLLRFCLARLERVLGNDHPTTLDTSKALLEWTTEKVNDKS